jgi:hypothetical protein
LAAAVAVAVRAIVAATQAVAVAVAADWVIQIAFLLLPDLVIPLLLALLVMLGAASVKAVLAVHLIL